MITTCLPTAELSKLNELDKEGWQLASATDLKKPDQRSGAPGRAYVKLRLVRRKQDVPSDEG